MKFGYIKGKDYEKALAKEIVENNKTPIIMPKPIEDMATKIPAALYQNDEVVLVTQTKKREYFEGGRGDRGPR